MADVDIDPFGEHNKTEEPTDENIPLDLVTPGRSTLGPQALWAHGNWNVNGESLLEVEVIQVYFTKNI